MAYDYEVQKQILLYGYNAERLSSCVGAVLRAVGTTGAIVALEAYGLPEMQRAFSNIWTRQGILDYLVEQGRLVVTDHPLSDFMQHRVYVSRAVLG